MSRALKKEFLECRVLMRETGRYIRSEVVGATPPKSFNPDTFEIEGFPDRWRLDSVSFRA